MTKPIPTFLELSIQEATKIVKDKIRKERYNEQGAMRDILTDLRHFCDAKGFDFHKACDGSYEVYLEEKYYIP